MAQSHGIQVLPPDINKSNADFTPDGNNIRFGLNSLKGVGLQICEMIEEEREKGGEFKSLYDFITRLNSKCINKKSVLFCKQGLFFCLKLPYIDKNMNLIVGKRKIPVDNLGSVTLNWYGQSGEYNKNSFKYIPVWKLEKLANGEKIKDDDNLDKNFFKNKTNKSIYSIL